MSGTSGTLKKKPSLPETSGKFSASQTQVSAGSSEAAEGNVRARQRSAPKKKAVRVASRSAQAAPANFAAKIRQVLASIQALGHIASLTPAQKRDIDNLQARLQEAGQEADKPAPDFKHIHNLLGNIDLLSGRLAGTLEQAKAVKSAIQRLLQDVNKLSE